jgi:hypothetical protein
MRRFREWLWITWSVYRENGLRCMFGWHKWVVWPEGHVCMRCYDTKA